jgi:predicted DsbA family dithiol-disulfide isomerase
VRGKDVTVEWMPFELRPETHPTLRPEGDYLQRVWAQSVYPLARQMGVDIRLPPVSPHPHTHLAWEGFQFAREHDKGAEYNHRVLAAFFVDGLDIGRPEVLARLAAQAGLDPAAFRTALDERWYRDAHRAALRHAHELGITGVPAFEVGGDLLVGVLPREALTALLLSG